MFNPPSSPPPSTFMPASPAVQRNSLLPAFELKKPSIREFLAPKQPKQTMEMDTNALLTPLHTSEANHQSMSPIPSSPQIENQINSNMFSEAKSQHVVHALIPSSGETVKIGRSSKSSKYALNNKNRLASRVHAMVWFNSSKNILSIECLGWNGLQMLLNTANGTETHEVAKGQIINTDAKDAKLFIHGDLVDLEIVDSNSSDATDDEVWSVKHAVKRSAVDVRGSDEKRVKIGESEPEMEGVLSELPTSDFVQPASELNYKSVSREDTREEAPKEAPKETHEESHEVSHVDVPPQLDSHREMTPLSEQISSFKSPSTPTSIQDVHTPKRRHEPLTPELKQELVNVATNFIAFSRQSAVPLQSIRKSNSQLQNLPKKQARDLIRQIECIGVIEGGIEDATGRKADDEYYYILEKDSDEKRRDLVQSSRGHRSLRNCRKTHKQYFYRPLKFD